MPRTPGADRRMGRTLSGPKGQFRLQMPKGYKVVTGMQASGMTTQYRIAFPAASASNSG